MATVFDKINQSAAGQQKSAQWYQSQVKKLGAINANQLMKEGVLTNQIFPGFMYMFFYDPKLKDSLPYFDRFPLVLPFRKVSDGFYGINLHYLPYMMRFKLLGYLSEYINDQSIDENTKLRMNWRMLTSSSKLGPVKACVKHYLVDHVQSRFLKIPYEDWVTASQLPVEKFVGSTKDRVWKDSKKKY